MGPAGASISIVVIASSNCSLDVRPEELGPSPQTLASRGVAAAAQLRRRRARGGFALAATIGFGWTLLVLLATFVLGFGLLAPLGGWQLGRRLLWLRSGLAEPRSALSDGALVTVASVLVLVPGLVTTTMGLLLLVPPIRALARPGLTAIAVRGFLRNVPLTADAAANMAGAFGERHRPGLY